MIILFLWRVIIFKFYVFEEKFSDLFVELKFFLVLEVMMGRINVSLWYGFDIGKWILRDVMCTEYEMWKLSYFLVLFVIR